MNEELKKSTAELENIRKDLMAVHTKLSRFTDNNFYKVFAAEPDFLQNHIILLLVEARLKELEKKLESVYGN